MAQSTLKDLETMSKVVLTLSETSLLLSELILKWQSVYLEYIESMQEYDRKKSAAYLNESTMGLKNQEMRDAEVTRILDQDGIKERYARARYEWNKYVNQKELLIEIARNLRTVERNHHVEADQTEI